MTYQDRSVLKENPEGDMGLFSKGKVGMNPGRPSRGSSEQKLAFARDVMMYFVAVFELEDESAIEGAFDLAEYYADMMVLVLQEQDPDRLEHVASSLKFEWEKRTSEAVEEVLVPVAASLYEICKHFRARPALKHLQWVENFL